MAEFKRPKRSRASNWYEDQGDEQIRPADDELRGLHDPPPSLEDAGANPDQARLLRQADADLRSAIYKAEINLSEPNELLFPNDPIVSRVVRTICDAAHLQPSDLPPDQPNAEFREMAEAWFAIKSQEDQEASNPVFFMGPRPQSPRFRRRQAIRRQLWQGMVARLLRQRKKAVVKNLVAHPAIPQRGRRICPSCGTSNGSKLRVCGCGFHFPPKVPKPVKLGKAEKFCPDCHAVFNSARRVCPLCRSSFRKVRPVLPPYIASLIRQISPFRRHQLQKAAAVRWKDLDDSRKQALRRVRAALADERRIDWRKNIYRREKRKREKDQELQFLLWVAARAVLDDF